MRKILEETQSYLEKYLFEIFKNATKKSLSIKENNDFFFWEHSS